MVDPALDSEPAAAFARGHNVFARASRKMDKGRLQVWRQTFTSFCTEDKDFFVAFDGGSVKARAELNKQFKAANISNPSVTDLLPQQKDLQARRDFALEKCGSWFFKVGSKYSLPVHRVVEKIINNFES